LARVRRLLRVDEDDEPRSISGLVAMSLAVLLAAGIAFQSSSSLAAQPPADWRTHKTDHFEIHYRPDLDLHAERVGREAERAYEQVSSDLRHNLAFSVPVILFATTNEFDESV